MPDLCRLCDSSKIWVAWQSPPGGYEYDGVIAEAREVLDELLANKTVRRLSHQRETELMGLAITIGGRTPMAEQRASRSAERKRSSAHCRSEASDWQMKHVRGSKHAVMSTS